MIDILTHTPLYVWALLAFLLWIGLRQSRPRLVQVWQIVVPAVVMSLYGFYGTGAAYHWNVLALGAWTLGALSGLVLLAPAGAAARAATRDPKSGLYWLPGSFWPLAVFLTIFTVKYALGVTAAMAPHMLSHPLVMMLACGLLGLCAGAMARRLLDFRVALRALQTA